MTTFAFNFRLPTATLKICSFYLATLLLLAGGCSSGGPATLDFTASGTGKSYSQDFSRAYFSSGGAGEYDVVLIEDGIAATHSNPRGPLQTAVTTPLSQTIHLKVLWRPLGGVHTDTPSATNAVIDWYVHSNARTDSSDRLHYRGAGFVQVYPSGDSARFVIRSARIELADGEGGDNRMKDPLGPSSVTASFDATRNNGMVEATLQLLRQEAQPPASRPEARQPLPNQPELPTQTPEAANQASAAHQAPPPRAPTEP